VILPGDSPRSRVFRDGNIYRNNLANQQVQFAVSVLSGIVDKFKPAQGPQENIRELYKQRNMFHNVCSRAFDDSRNTVYVFIYLLFEHLLCSVKMRIVENETTSFQSSKNLTITISGYSLYLGNVTNI